MQPCGPSAGGRSALAAMCSLSALLVGCELIAAVDHDRIGGGGSGGGTTSASTTAAAGGMGGGTTSTGGGGTGGAECTAASECPTPTSECKQATCSAGSCGEENELVDVPCNAGADKCDGAGNCVECTGNADCTSPATCVAGDCTSPACMNGMLDVGTETDVDCGGTCPAGCMNTEVCAASADCVSGFCSSLVCAACTGTGAGQCAGTDYCSLGVCGTKEANGTVCTAAAQCMTGHCVALTGGGSVCCDMACTEGCKSCKGTETGAAMNGQCQNVTTATDPKNACDDECVTAECSAGACSPSENNGTPCGAAASCSGASLNQQDNCQAGVCTSPTVDCGNYLCDSAADPDVCLTVCGAQADCDAGFYCVKPPATGMVSNACEAKKAATASCGNDLECISGSCTAMVCL